VIKKPCERSHSPRWAAEPEKIINNLTSRETNIDQFMFDNEKRLSLKHGQTERPKSRCYSEIRENATYALLPFLLRIYL
jgi:hypothetical protein